MCIDYSPFISREHEYVLASGSRDRVIKLFSSREDYTCIKTIEDHTSSLVGLKFGFDPKERDPFKTIKDHLLRSR